MTNISDVAARAGVSRTTVSLVLNGRGDEHGIAGPTQQRVQEAATALRYRPNYHGRTFLRGRSDMFGWCTSACGRSSPFLAQLHAGIVQRAFDHGMDVITVTGRTDGDALLRGLQFVHERRIDALLLPWHVAQGHWAELAREPVVILMPWEACKLPWVGLDPAPGIAEAVLRAAACGHRHLAYLGFDDGHGISTQRARLYRQAAEQHGLSFHATTLARDQWSDADPPSPALAGVAAALTALGPATTIACHSDLLALAVLQVLRERGLQVPKDVSLIGFDDVAAAYAQPRLATISHALPALGTAAVDLALAGGTGHRLVPASFVDGASLGRSAIGG